MPRTAPVSKRSVFVGQWLRNRRVALKRSLEQCAAMSGYSMGTHSEVERGLVDFTTLDIRAIPGFASAYKIKPEALLWRLSLIEKPEWVDD